MVKRQPANPKTGDRATAFARRGIAVITLGVAGCCLLTALPAMAQKRLTTALLDQPHRRQPDAGRPADLVDLSMSSVNPFVHYLDSGLKFRGIRLFDQFYLARQKRGSDSPARTLGISYADDDILYYFSPERLSISFRY